MTDKKKKYLAYLLALSVLIISGLVFFRMTRLNGLKYVYLGDLETENATELVNVLRREIKQTKDKPS